MKIVKELRNLTLEEMEQRVHELQKELMKENSKATSAMHPSNPGQLRQMKKTIARIHTLQRIQGVPEQRHG